MRRRVFAGQRRWERNWTEKHKRRAVETILFGLGQSGQRSKHFVLWEKQKRGVSWKNFLLVTGEPPPRLAGAGGGWNIKVKNSRVAQEIFCDVACLSKWNRSVKQWRFYFATNKLHVATKFSCARVSKKSIIQNLEEFFWNPLALEFFLLMGKEWKENRWGFRFYKRVFSQTFLKCVVKRFSNKKLCNRKFACLEFLNGSNRTNKNFSLANYILKSTFLFEKILTTFLIVLVFEKTYRKERLKTIGFHYQIIRRGEGFESGIKLCRACPIWRFKNNLRNDKNMIIYKWTQHNISEVKRCFFSIVSGKGDLCYSFRKVLCPSRVAFCCEKIYRHKFITKRFTSGLVADHNVFWNNNYFSVAWLWKQ